MEKEKKKEIPLNKYKYWLDSIQVPGNKMIF